MRALQGNKTLLLLLTLILALNTIDLITDAPSKTVDVAKEYLYIVVIGVLMFSMIYKKKELGKTREAEQRLTTLINSMVDFVNFKDGEGRWIEANEFGLKLFQLEGVDYRGKKDSELAEYTSFYKEALIYCEHSDEEAWENRTTTRCEERIPMPDGSFKIFDSIKVPLYYENGSRKGLVVIGRDITEKQLTEERLRRTEKLSVVGELAASIGHEIRNPLTSLKGFVQMFRKDTNDERQQYYFDIMLDELERINHIVGELLILAKPQKISISNHSVNAIMKNVLSLLETQANMNSVTLDYQESEDIVIECSDNLLKQLFINIVKNGIEASESNSTVSVNVERYNEEEVRIAVVDKGVGFSEDFLTRIGEPFYSSKEKGTGLGLTVSMKIVEQHGGRLNFCSEKNAGTTVEIILPISYPYLSNQ